MPDLYHITGVYFEERDQRANEICDAIQMNVANPAIKEVHLRVEEDPEKFLGAVKDGKRKPDQRLAELMQSSKVVVSVLGRCAQYQDFFDYAADRLDGKIVVLTNADIGLEPSIERVHEADFSDAFLCISRREYIWRPPTCQDAWVFRVPLRCRAEWKFGYPGSEVKLAYEVEQQGYRVCNPSPVIKVRHFHWTQKRRYKIPEDIIPGPHRDTYPSDMRPVRKDRPRGTRAVVTVVDAALRDIYGVTKPRMADYAKKIGADLVEIPAAHGKHMLGVFDKYERVIYLEPDVLVHPEAPNLFDVVPERELGMLNESYHVGQKWLVPWQHLYNKYGYAPDAIKMQHWNPNVMVVDIWNAFLFDNPAGAYDRRLGNQTLKGGDFAGAIQRDEVHMSVMARHFHLPVKEYDITFNYKPAMQRPKPTPFFINLKDIPTDRKVEAAKAEEARWTS